LVSIVMVTLVTVTVLGTDIHESSRNNVNPGRIFQRSTDVPDSSQDPGLGHGGTVLPKQ
jgi:hypothetical protein